MSNESEKTVNNGHAVLKLCILCVALYACSYLCRESIDSNINEMMAFFGKDKAAIGLVGTCFFVAYAVGQVIHGFLCKYYNPRYVVFLMAVPICLINIAIGLLPATASAFAWIKYLWLVNGFLSASFWSVVVLTLNANTAKKYRSMVMFCVSLPVTIGTFLMYGFSSLMSFFKHFQISFFVAGGVFLLVATAWLLFAGKLIDTCKAEKDLLDAEEEPSITDAQTEETPAKKGRIPKGFYVMFSVFAVFAIIHMLIRKGINTWLPTILTDEYGMANWISVLLTILVPLTGFAGALAVLQLYKKVCNYFVICAVCFGVTTLCLGVLLLCSSLSSWLVTFVTLLLASTTMVGVNNFITNIFPINCDKNVNAGRVAGYIDGFCYVGSAVSSYGIGSLSDRAGGWNGVFILFFGLALLCFFIATACTFIQKKKPGLLSSKG